MTDRMKELADRFIAATRPLDAFEKMVNGLLGSLTDKLKSAEKERCDRAIAAFLVSKRPEFTAALTATYATHYSEAEMAAAVEWHESPIAARMRDCTPAIDEAIKSSFASVVGDQLEAVIDAALDGAA